jgi:Ca-activated chloride channel homolog
MKSLFRNAILHARKTKQRPTGRRGSIFVLAGASFFAMAGLAGLCINVSYMELIRSEQRLATDAAAKAALVVLGQSQSPAQARQAAQTIAALHRIGGKPVILADSDIKIGASAAQSNGQFQFSETSSTSSVITNSIRVTSSLDRLPGGVPLIVMPQMMGRNSYTAEQSAASTRIEMDVCLVVDRSGSMAWSLGPTPFAYPGDLAGKSPIQNYFQLPHASLSRWAALSSSIDTFISVLQESPIRSRVSLASYASNFTFGIWTSSVASVDQTLTTDYTKIRQKMNALATQPLIGNTNIAAGLREGVNSLTDPVLSRVTSSRSIVLLTDGIMSQGDDPVALATLARTMNIRTHTIAFSSQADVALMRRVAQAGGGNCYVAPDAAALTAAFRTIAATLPNMLTE